MVHEMAQERRWGPRKPISVGADKAYDTREFVATLRANGGTTARSAEPQTSWRQRDR